MALNIQQPPPGFVDLSTSLSSQGKSWNVIGVCVDHLPCVKSGGSDFTIKFTLHDPSWHHGGRGLDFRCFHLDASKLPAIKENGDVVILRNIKIKEYHGQLIGLSSSITSWVVLFNSSLIEPIDENDGHTKFEKSEKAFAPTSSELSYARAIWKQEDPFSFAKPQKSTVSQAPTSTPSHVVQPTKRREKFSLIKDLEVPTNESVKIFADLVGEVRRIWNNDHRVELSITDYTSHPMLYNYVYGCDEEGTDGDRFGYSVDKSKKWPGPWGQMTMMVAFWDENSAYILRNVEAGSFVALRNVHIKLGRDQVRLEGACRMSAARPGQINISVLKPREGEADERIVNLIRRKREYEKKTSTQNIKFIRDPRPVKRNSEHLDGEGSNQPKSKKGKQREKKKQKKAREETEEGQTKIDQSGTTAGDKQPVSRFASNTHVECNNLLAAVKPISEILDPEILQRKTTAGNLFHLPFQNCCYKVKVRVVDFYPDSLADFSVPRRWSEYDVLSDGGDSDADSDGHSSSSSSSPPPPAGEDVKWEWRFAVLVEDARPPGPGSPKHRMELLIAGTDGEFLLNQTACDLRRHPKDLDVLREKLCVLWGDLEEKKKEGGEDEDGDFIPSNRPFECYVKEYGVPVDRTTESAAGYERRFGLWGTRIK